MDKAHKITDKKLATIERNIRRIFGKCAKEVKKTSDEFLAAFKIKDEKMRARVAAGAMSEADYLKWRNMQMIMGSRYRQLSEKLTAEMLHSYEAAIAYSNGQLPGIYALNYNAIEAKINSAVKGYSFELVDAQTVANLAANKTTLLPYKVVDGKKFVRWSTAKTNSTILSGIMKGDSIPKIADSLVKVVGMSRNTAVTNARTMVTSAENAGRIDSMKRAEKNGTIIQKEWIATHDSRTRDWHRDLDGVSVPLDQPFENDFGEIRFPGDPAADPANVYNCFIGETNIATDCDIIRSYKHDYSGNLIRVHTAGGVDFTCTPNHPILTPDGWVAAKLLKQNDNLLIASVGENFLLRVDPNINHAFPRIDAIHQSLDVAGGDRTIGEMVNFHGDVPTSDVEIITQKRFLRNDGNPGGRNRVDKLLFKLPDEAFSSDSATVQHFGRVSFSPFRFMRRFRKTATLFWRRLCHAVIHGFRSIARRNSAFIKASDNSTSSDVQFCGESFDGFPSVVCVDNIVNIQVFTVSHIPVYNLQTENGHYFVNDIIPQNREKCNGKFAIAHNCRCTIAEKVIGFRPTR